MASSDSNGPQSPVFPLPGDTMRIEGDTEQCYCKVWHHSANSLWLTCSEVIAESGSKHLEIHSNLTLHWPPVCDQGASVHAIGYEAVWVLSPSHDESYWAWLIVLVRDGLAIKPTKQHRKLVLHHKHSGKHRWRFLLWHVPKHVDNLIEWGVVWSRW